jgi:hypothetical protein
MWQRRVGINKENLIRVAGVRRRTVNPWIGSVAKKRLSEIRQLMCDSRRSMKPELPSGVTQTLTTAFIPMPYM